MNQRWNFTQSSLFYSGGSGRCEEDLLAIAREVVSRDGENAIPLKDLQYLGALHIKDQGHYIPVFCWNTSHLQGTLTQGGEAEGPGHFLKALLPVSMDRLLGQRAESTVSLDIGIAYENEHQQRLIFEAACTSLPIVQKGVILGVRMDEGKEWENLQRGERGRGQRLPVQMAVQEWSIGGAIAFALHVKPDLSRVQANPEEEEILRAASALIHLDPAQSSVKLCRQGYLHGSGSQRVWVFGQLQDNQVTPLDMCYQIQMSSAKTISLAVSLEGHGGNALFEPDNIEEELVMDTWQHANSPKKHLLQRWALALEHGVGMTGVPKHLCFALMVNQETATFAATLDGSQSPSSPYSSHGSPLSPSPMNSLGSSPCSPGKRTFQAKVLISQGL